MDNVTLAEKATKLFETGDGRIVDVMYSTSAGGFFFSYGEAEDAAKKLEDKSVMPFYRDPVVRDMAKKFKELNRMMVATDYVKYAKLKRKLPEYEEYTAYVDQVNEEAIAKPIFEFIKSKVWRVKRPTATGIRDKIFMYEKGIVDAVFLRSYPHGMIWQVGDTLVFTCPTNTELMSGTYMQIFSPMFAAVK